jgi:hypothetical protein
MLQFGGSATLGICALVVEHSMQARSIRRAECPLRTYERNDRLFLRGTSRADVSRATRGRVPRIRHVISQAMLRRSHFADSVGSVAGAEADTPERTPTNPRMFCGRHVRIGILIR